MTYKRNPVTTVLCILVVALQACLSVPGFAEASDPIAARSEHYNIAQASRDGIGKFYLGREISHVMGHLGAGWLERPQRVQEERTDLLLAALKLRPDDTVVDLGAGTGYFSFPMAKQVPEGRVLAVDIQPQMLAIIEQRIVTGSVPNVEPRLAQECDPLLSDVEVDVVLLVDAYHEFSCPREVMQAITASLAADGRVLLVEYRGEDSTIGIKPLHTMTLKQAKKEMAAVGLDFAGVSDVLPKQHLMTFRKADNSAPD
ncbi:methyltransferase domain-containing protein [Halioglobus maricola]|uniref:Methyltransferase domain-containing protein n=1 Tax=Halioglobus maricola TaxID=2601894 RepID=A0A5P9NF29_9GAMM|nr:class I SAM-dependent methyltransferase [Halioglobus maricola]QFU74373.1 methyltransferase domain-containing protein [Halioglobus maricola]